MSSILLSNIKRSYGTQTVVDDLSIEVEDGEFLTLLGPSGCGKSTILRMLAGLDQPTAGNIMFDGQRVNDTAPGHRNVSMVFQSYALYPHMTVRENLAYPLKKRRGAKSERKRLVAEISETLQIVPLLDRRSSQLSGGQQQRVALGRAMIRDPDVFLFDEPLSNLDATLRAHMRAEIIRLHLKLGKTMVYVTHDQIEAMTMSTRIAVLDGGKLQQLDTPAEVYARPATRFVAGFVGTPRMNFLSGALVAGEGGSLFRSDDGIVEVALPGLHAGNLAVEAGIRSQDIILTDSGPSGTVTLIESTGLECFVTVTAGAHDIVVRLDESNGLRIGQTVHFGLRPGKLHLFDAGTGLRINLPDEAAQ